MLGCFVDEACNLFPSSPSAALTESEHLKPAVLLPLRTGSVPKRSLLKSQPPPDASQSMIGAGTEKALNTKTDLLHQHRSPNCGYVKRLGLQGVGPRALLR